MLLAGVNGRWSLLAWFLLGAFVMRSAGCAYNDFVDRELDAKVARTRLRPLASGRITNRAAWILIILLAFIGLIVLLQLPLIAQVTAISSLGLVAAYPFMKRITWWPQAWLGLVFSWGALVGWASVARGLDPAAWWLWVGSVFWVVGYDTLYAIQDKEDDALVGVRSSARRLGRQAPLGVALFYVLALGGWTAALWSVRPEPLAVLALVPAAFHLLSQVLRVDPDDGDKALALFRSNRFTGLLLALGFAVVGLSSAP
jgi:4-hydroxybenzoate polyprenyltransferase